MQILPVDSRLRIWCFTVFTWAGINSICAQLPDKLFGAHVSGNSSLFSSIQLPAYNYSQVSAFSNPFSPAPGETTFDEIRLRYFVKTGSKILVFDVTSGAIVDSILNVSTITNIEYDRTSNSIVGLYPFGSSIQFVSYSLKNKTFKTKSTLPDVTTVQAGESTFDPVNRRFFAMTNLGMVSIDSAGTLLDVLCAPPFANGIEYDIATNRIYYMEWKGSNFDFTSVEATSCVPGYIGPLPANDSLLAPGESTFDRSKGIYFTRSNTGLIQVDISTGLVVHQPASNNFAQIEFADFNPVSIKERSLNNSLSVYPSPSKGPLMFKGLQAGSVLRITDASGKIIIEINVAEAQTSLNLEDQAKGLYFYQLVSGDKIINGEFVLY